MILGLAVPSDNLPPKLLAVQARVGADEYGLRLPTHACQIFVYRAFDLWSQIGPMYRATVSVTQFMILDEILWRIAVYWQDLGNYWQEASWRLHPVDDSGSASCLRDLI